MMRGLPRSLFRERTSKEGLVLEASTDGTNWAGGDFDVKMDGDGHEWQRAVILLDFNGRPEPHWFPLALLNSLSKESVQIGEVVFSGLKEN